MCFFFQQTLYNVFVRAYDAGGLPAVIVTDWRKVLFSNSIFPELTGLDEVVLISDDFHNFFDCDIDWKSIKKIGRASLKFYNILGQKKFFDVYCNESNGSYVLTLFESGLDKKTTQSENQGIEECGKFLELAPIGLYRATPDGRLISANETLAKMLGYESSDRMNVELKSLGAHIDPALLGERVKKWKNIKEFGKPFEFQVRRLDGSTIWLRDQGNLEFDENGEIAVIEGMLTDVTAEHEIRELLWNVKSNLEDTVEEKDKKLINATRRERIVARRLKTILDSIPDVAWLKDKNFNVIAANQSYVNLAGFSSPDDCLGKNDFDIWPEEIAMVYRGNDIEVVESRKKIVFEEPIITPEKKVLFYETIKLPVFDDLNEIIGIAGISRDVTSRKRQQEELEILVAERTRDLERINEQLLEEIEEHKRLEVALDESNQRFKNLIRLSPDVIMVIDKGGHILSFQNGQGYFLDTNTTEILDTKKIEDFPFKNGADDLNRAIDSIEKAIESGRLQSFEFSGVFEDICRHYQARIVKKDADSVVVFARDITVLKNAHIKIEDSERKFRDLFNFSPEPMIITGIDSRKIVDVNEAMLDFIDKDSDEIIGLTLLEFVDKCSIFLTEESLDALKNAPEKTSNLEIDFIYGDSGVKHSLYSSSVVSINGESCIISVFRDITERKQQQILLNQSNIFLDTMVSTLHEVVFVKDLEGRYTYYRWPEYEGHPSFDVSKLIGKKIEEIEVKPDRIAESNKAFNDVIESGCPVTYYTNLKLSISESNEVMEVTLSPMKDADGNITSVVGVAKSITEKVVAEQRVKVSEERYKKLSEGVNSPIFVHDGERFVYFNAAFSKAIGYSRDELEEMEIYKILHPDMVDRMKEQFKKRVAGESVPIKGLVNIITKSGEELIWELLISGTELDGKKCSLISATDITKLKKKEKALIESRNNYAQLVNAVPDLIFTISAEGRYIEYRAIDESDLYIPSDEIIGKTVFDTLPESIASEVIGKIRTVLNTKEFVDFEYSLDFGEKTRYFQARIGYRDEDSVISVIRDISDIKRAQNKLRSSNEFLNSVVTSMYEVVWAKDLEGRYTYYRWPELEKNGAFDPKEYVGGKAEDFISQQAHIQLTNQMFEKVIKTGEDVSYRTEVFVESLERTEIMNISLTPLLDNDGKIVGVIGVGKSITQQFLAEEKARYFEKRYAGIVEAVEDLIFEIRNEIVMFVSPSLKKLVGVDPKTLVGKSIYDVADEWQITSADDLTLSKKFFEFCVVDKRGKTRYFDTRMSKVGSSLFGVAREITRKKYLEQAKEKYYSSLMHELKNPLVLIQGYSEMLEPKLDGDELDMLKIIQESAKRQDRRLTELSTKNASGRNYKFMQVNAYESIKKSVDYLAKLFPMLSNKHHGHDTSVFSSNIDERLKKVQLLIDVESLDEVFENLVSNAVKYSPGDRVHVSLVAKKLDNARVEVSVTDKGYGIPEDELKKIFKPFYRIDNDNTLEIEGTGIGLANSKLHVEVNDGEIFVESTPGEGSTFRVVLPIYSYLTDDSEQYNPLLD